MMLEELYPLEWEIDLDANLFGDNHLYLLPIPIVWREAINELSKDYSRYAEKQPPIVSLHITLQQAFPELVCVFSKAFWDQKYNENYWILSKQPISLDRIHLFMITWLTAIGSEYGQEKVKTIAQKLDTNLLKWQTFDLKNVGTYKALWAIPSLIAHFLVDTEYRFCLTDSKDQLMAPRELLVTQTTDASAELVTWQPESLKDASIYDYSYTLQFYAKSHHDRNKVRLFLTPGIRRWVSQSMTWTNKQGELRPGIPYDPKKVRRTSVYYRNSDTSSLVPLKLANYGNTAHWVGFVYRSLQHIVPVTTIARPMELLDKPKSFQDRLLIVYSTQMSYSKNKRLLHAIGAGIETADRYEIYAQLNDVFPDGVSPAPAWKRAKNMRRVKRHPAEKSRNEEIDGAITSTERQAGAKNIAPFCIELYVSSDKVSMWREAFLNELGCKENELNSLGIEITECKLSNSLFSWLDEVAEKDKKRGRINAIEHRISEFEKSAPHTKVMTGVIVEMANYSYTPQDPKDAIRLGLAHVGRVSQFIQPESESTEDYKIRVESSVRDLLRQLGYSYSPPHMPLMKSQMPHQIDIIALHMLDNRIPVVVHAPADESVLQVYMNTPDGIEFYENSFYARLALAPIPDDYKMKEPITFFNRILNDLVNNVENILVLIDSEKMGGVFNDLRKATKQATLNILDTDNKSVRIAKLTFSGNQHGVAVPGVTVRNFSGLFQDKLFDNRFYAFRSRPVTQQKKRLRQRDNPRRNAWNPATMQIELLNMQDGDVSVEWAHTVRNLCEVVAHYSDSTRLPEPLYTAEGLSEYLIGVSRTKNDEDASSPED